MAKLEILDPGGQSLVEDRGRCGYAHLGVGWSGAADQGSYALANRLVGNRAGVACIEVTMGGLQLRPAADVYAALTGADCGARLRGVGQAVNSAFWVRAGDVLELGRPAVGLRSYVAVRGGVIGEEVLGSMSWDSLGQLGTPPLRAGDRVGVGDCIDEWPAISLAPGPSIPAAAVEVPLLLGPRADWFTKAAIDSLTRESFTVSPDLDRVGVRLDGPSLPRRSSEELASEGVVLGALQVPTSGRPTVFLVDHPVTGGYPVIGVVPAAYVDRVAQLIPGQSLRFRICR